MTVQAVPAATTLLADIQPIMGAHPAVLGQWASLATDLRKRATKTRTDQSTAAAVVRRTSALADYLVDVVAVLPQAAAALRAMTEPPPPITTPLYLYLTPDRYFEPLPNDAFTGTDLGTGTDTTVSGIGNLPPMVSWWPRVPDDLADDLAWSSCPVDVLELPKTGPQWVWSPTWGLLTFAATFAAVTARAAGFDEAADTLPIGPDGGNTKGALYRTARRYTAIGEHLAPIGARIVTEFRDSITTAYTELAALLADDTTPNGRKLTMPTLLGTPAAISDLAQNIRTAIDSGHGGRLQVSSTAEQAFTWAGTPRTLLSYLATGQTDTRRFTVAIAKDSVTPVAPVAEGGAKPNLVDFTSEDLDLLKFAGSATMSTESAQFIANIEQATSTVMVGRILRAIEADASAEIIADAGVEITAAADITAGTISAIAAIASNGGTANVVGLSSAAWVEIMTAQGTAGGYVNFSSPESGPGQTWLGLVPLLVPGLPANTSIVLDGSGATVTEIKGGPLCVVDVFTQASTNKLSIYLETWAKTAVTSPGVVASVVTATTP